MSRLKRPMTRLCYVIPGTIEPGAAHALAALMKGLVGDHELTLVCPARFEALREGAQALGVQVHVIEGEAAWSFALRCRFRRLFRAHRPDVVHLVASQTPRWDFAVCRAARDTGVPAILLDRRGLAGAEDPSAPGIPKKVNRLVDAIVVRGQAEAQSAVARPDAPATRVHAMPVGADGDAAPGFVDASPVPSCDGEDKTADACRRLYADLLVRRAKGTA